MTRLPFAAAVLFVLSCPAGAEPPIPPAPPSVTDVAEADYLDAAKRLFSTPVEQQAFIFKLKNDLGLAGDIRTALAAARKAGGDDAAVTAALLKDPTAAQALTDIPGDVAAARKALDTGLHAKTPTTDFSGTPLIGALMTRLGKKDPADLLVALNAGPWGGPVQANPAAAADPCKKGNTEFNKLVVSAENGQLADGTPCQPGVVPTNVVTAPDRSTARPTTPVVNGPASSVTDMRPTTGVPPKPGSDKGPGGSSSGGGFPFSMGTMTSVGLMAGMGALIGTFGGPVGIVAGAILGGLFGLFISTRKGDDAG